MSEVLAPDAVDDALAKRRTGWRREGDEIVKVADLGDFAGSLAYVQRVGELAERAGHHPDIDIRWRHVTLRLSTHSAGGITARDLGLAEQIDAIGTPPPA